MTKKRMRRGWAAIAAALLVGASISMPAVAASGADGDVTPALFPENRNLNAQQVQERTEQLTAEYRSVGQVLTDVDAEFVKLYAYGGSAWEPASDAASSDAPTTVGGPYYFKKTGSGAGGSGTIWAKMRLDIGDFSTNNSYSAKVTSSGSTAVKKVKNCVHVRSYGIVGQGGVGLVYASDPCDSLTGRKLTMTRNQNYSALVIYATITADATFYTNAGSFQVAT